MISAYNKIQHNGFTFIEVLVVILIFSVVFTLITLSTSLFSSSTLILKRAHTQMMAKIYLIQEQALMNQTLYRMKAIESSYGFEYYQPDSNRWVEVTRPRTLRAIRLKSDIRLQIIGDKNQPIDEVMFYPQGEMTPFVITFRNKDDESIELIGYKDGTLKDQSMESQNES